MPFFLKPKSTVWLKNGSKNVLIAEVSKIWVLAIFYYTIKELFYAKI
jgi:hypothetical protein